MIPTRPTRDRAIAYITHERTETVIDNDWATTFRYVPVAVAQVGESHWWSVDDVYGSRDQPLPRELSLWHICFSGGEWCILRWSGSEATRTDCPADLADMVRTKQKRA